MDRETNRCIYAYVHADGLPGHSEATYESTTINLSIDTNINKNASLYKEQSLNRNIGAVAGKYTEIELQT